MADKVAAPPRGGFTRQWMSIKALDTYALESKLWFDAPPGEPSPKRAALPSVTSRRACTDSCNVCAIGVWLFLSWVAQGAFMAVQILNGQENGPEFGRILAPLYALGIVFGMPLMGKLSDRHGRKAGFLADSLGTAVSSAGTGALYALGLSEWWLPIFGLMFLWGFAGCGTSVTAASIGDIFRQGSPAQHLRKPRSAQRSGRATWSCSESVGCTWDVHSTVKTCDTLWSRGGGVPVHTSQCHRLVRI